MTMNKEAIRLNPMSLIGDTITFLAQNARNVASKITPQQALETVVSRARSAKSRAAGAIKDRFFRVPYVGDYMLIDEANKALSANPNFQRMREIAEEIARGKHKPQYMLTDILPGNMSLPQTASNEKFISNIGNHVYSPSFSYSFHPHGNKFSINIPTIGGVLPPKIMGVNSKSVVMHELGEGLSIMHPMSLYSNPLIRLINSGSTPQFVANVPKMRIYKSMYPQGRLFDFVGSTAAQNARRLFDFIKAGESGALPGYQLEVYNRLKNLYQKLPYQKRNSLEGTFRSLDNVMIPNNTRLFGRNHSGIIRFDQNMTPRIYMSSANHASPLPYLTELAQGRMSPTDKAVYTMLRVINDGDIWRETLKRHRNVDSFLTGGFNQFYDEIGKMYPNMERYTFSNQIFPDVNFLEDVFIVNKRR